MDGVACGVDRVRDRYLCLGLHVLVSESEHHLDRNSDHLSDVATFLSLISTLAGRVVSPILGVALGLITVNASHHVDHLQEMPRIAAGANSRMIFSMRWWEVAVGPTDGALVNHWGSASITTDATECRDHDDNHIARPTRLVVDGSVE